MKNLTNSLKMPANRHTFNQERIGGRHGNAYRWDGHFDTRWRSLTPFRHAPGHHSYKSEINY